MVRILLISFLTIATLFSATSCGIVDYYTRDYRNAKRWNETTAKEFVKISELRKKNTDGTTYETEGYVVDSMPECKCPIGYACKCHPASITISEANNPRKSRDLDENEIRISTNPEGFKRDQKYRFKVSVSEFDLGRELLDSVDLVAYRLKDKSD